MYPSNSDTIPQGPAPTIMEAIVRTRCVTAMYNGGRVVLAPHVLFMRNDALYVGAVTITRGGLVPREEKLGLFKLDGLGELALTEEAFTPSAVYDAEDERYATSALLAVELVAA